jgi:hypothetical protein
MSYNRGAAGPKGDTGAKGARGTIGIRGPKGDIGATGAIGSSLTTINNTWTGVNNFSNDIVITSITSLNTTNAPKILMIDKNGKVGCMTSAEFYAMYPPH